MYYCLISVITVVYNNVSMIESTIQSVVSSNFSDFEYIVIDGNSNDGTTEVIKKYSNQITQFISESDNGIYHAMNKGVNLSKGLYCIFMNSGDRFVDKDVLSTFSKVLQTNKYDIVYGDVITSDINGNTNLRKAELPCNKHRMYFCHQSAFVSTYLLKKYPYDESYNMSADLKFFKQCYNLGYPFKYISQSVALYNMQGFSNVHRIKGLKENIRVIKENDKGIEKIRLLLRIFPTYFFQRIMNYFASS